MEASPARGGLHDRHAMPQVWHPQGAIVKHALFKRVGEMSVLAPTREDADALARKQAALMETWASRSIINATVRHHRALIEKQLPGLTRGKLAT